jgi:DNA polymerase-3 subunit alpha
MKYFPQHVHTSYSLLDGIVKPEKIAKRCKELGYTHCSITDHGSVSGAIKFAKVMEKNGIIPVLGVEFYCSYHDSNIKDENNRKLFHTVVISKNKASWYKLLKAVSLSNHPSNFYYKPRLDLQKLSDCIDDSCFILSGHPGSLLWDCKTEDSIIEKIGYLKKLFGDSNVILEMQRFMDDEDVKEHLKILESASLKTNARKIACEDIHYTNKEDAKLQRIVLCSNLRKTLPEIEKMKPEDRPMSAFFNCEKFYLHSMEELKSFGHTEDELDMSFIIDQIEPVKLQEQPKLPKFSSNEAELLTEECRKGWRKKSKLTWDKVYVDRVKMEIETFSKWNLCGYFLIVSEYIRWAKSQGMLVGPARGSSLGSLVAYLMDITEIDPIPYDLFFWRFFNDSRCSVDNVSLPDIDTDFPADRRDEIFEHLRDKYGRDYVAQIATFGTLKGKAALKETFRVCEVFDFETMNKITKGMPDEADIADELEEQNEDSIIMWCLRNQPKMFQDYCVLDNGELKGDYAQYFKTAIELEGIHKSQGKHAAGVIVSSEKLSDIAPMIYDGKTGEAIVALDKKDAEIIGLVKFDILSLSALDKLMSVNNLLKYGKINV